MSQDSNRVDWHSRLANVRDVLGLLPEGGPAVANWAITTACNANCDFCGYARDKQNPSDFVWVDTERACAGITLLHKRGVRYLTFTGGEPTMHRGLPTMIAHATKLGMRVSLVSNAFTLAASRLAQLHQAGLRTLFISVDAQTATEHETNRGLPGVAERIRLANDEARQLDIPTVASVTISRLITDWNALGAFLTGLGFSTVTFSYPKTAVYSSSKVFSASSSLIDFTAPELIGRFEAIRSLKRNFRVLNPDAGLAEMIRHLAGEPERIPCIGGFKYFYIDPFGMVFRCDYWETPLCPIEEFGEVSFVRDRCTRCMSDCYRDSSVFLHLPVAIGDAMRQARQGRLGAAARTLAARTTRTAVGALIREWYTLRKLAAVPEGTAKETQGAKAVD
jgi:MoaA/NifB/PqqE/SkfB family radical SAM enzyme